MDLRANIARQLTGAIALAAAAAAFPAAAAEHTITMKGVNYCRRSSTPRSEIH